MWEKAGTIIEETKQRRDKILKPTLFKNPMFYLNTEDKGRHYILGVKYPPNRFRDADYNINTQNRWKNAGKNIAAKWSLLENVLTNIIQGLPNVKRWEPLQLTTRKTPTFDILPQLQCMTNGPWKRSILIYHKLHHKWNSEISSTNGSLEPKVSGYVFFHFWPKFIDSPEKDQFWYNSTNMENEISKWAPKRLNWAQISWKWAGNMFPHFDPILFIVQSNY